MTDQRPPHECPGPDCTKQVAYELYACRRHWYQVPLPLRKAVYDTWAGGAGAGTPEHIEALQLAFERMTP